MLGVRNGGIVVLLCDWMQVAKWQQGFSGKRHPFFTWLDSKLLKLRGVSPLASIGFDMILFIFFIAIKNNRIMDLKILQHWKLCLPPVSLQT